jgi:hypothetical protein
MFKKILQWTLIVLAVVIAAFLGLVAMQPNEFRVERSLTMVAPPADVFAQVNDFHNWEAWSPWIKLDPNAKGTYEGPAAGKGAIFRWSGNDDVGEGSMTITESNPNDLIRITLNFIKPFEDTATSEFTFQPEGDQTRVTWSMYGKNNFVGRAVCLLMDMDEMIGSKYEEGLASMKQIVESKPKEQPAPAADSGSSEASTPAAAEAEAGRSTN